jgi:cysteine desulfuration protein SufE
MVSEKIKKINDTLEDLKIANMGLHYLVDLGKISRDSFPEEDRIEENFIHGCTSFAWIKLESPDPIEIRTVSDSMIIGGMLALLEKTFNGEPKSSIDNYDGQNLIDGFGLDGHISTQRLRGFAEAVRMMKGIGKPNLHTRMEERISAENVGG